MSDTPPKKRPGRPRGSGSFAWRAFFQHSATPVFVLGKGRRLRYANPAWEKLTGVKLADALGMVCSARRNSSPLAAALAPTPEAQAGKPDAARRPPPHARTGPPWWDVIFQPLAADDGVVGVVGFVRVVGEPAAGVARRIPAVVGSLREKHAGHFSFDLFAGPAPATRRFLAQLRHAATSAAPAWLVGEPGSGKETAARVLHHAGQRGGAFVGIDCAGLQPYLVESLLFGHGGLLAGDHVGTLYLKEPSALPRDLQQHLADHFAENKPGAPRLVCGSSRTAGAEVSAGKLVAEFHTSLSVLELTVPPLRDRLADLPRYAAGFVPGIALDPAALAVLELQPWRGNLRELADVLAGIGAGPLKAEQLPRELRVRAGIDPPPAAPKSLALGPILEEVERRLIRLVLRKANNHQTKAAEMLGVFRARLWARLTALGIPVPPQPPKPRKKDKAESS
jgi:transcriptional regulator with PAS, ATPase and Fis domain